MNFESLSSFLGHYPHLVDQNDCPPCDTWHPSISVCFDGVHNVVNSFSSINVILNILKNVLQCEKYRHVEAPS